MVDDTQEMVFYPEDIKRIEERAELGKHIKEILDKKPISLDDCIFIIDHIGCLSLCEIESLSKYLKCYIRSCTSAIKNLTRILDVCEKLQQEPIYGSHIKIVTKDQKIKSISPLHKLFHNYL